MISEEPQVIDAHQLLLDHMVDQYTSPIRGQIDTIAA